MTIAYTPEEMIDLKRIAEDAVKMFQPGYTKYWESKRALANAVKSFANANHFAVALQGSAFWCSRAKETNAHKKRRENQTVPPEKRRKVQPRRCDCGFVIRFTAAPSRMEGAPPGSVRVTEGSCFMHTNGCRPGHQQLHRSNIAAGYYSKMILAHDNVHQLFDLMRNSDSFVSVKTLREFLKPMVPDNFPLTAVFLCNLRTKILTLLSKGDDGIHQFAAGIGPCPGNDSDSDSFHGLPIDSVDSCSPELALEGLDDGGVTAIDSNKKRQYEAAVKMGKQTTDSGREMGHRCEAGRAQLPIASKPAAKLTRNGSRLRSQPHRNKQNHAKSSNESAEKLEYRTYMDLCIELWDLIHGREDINYFSGALSKLIELARSKETHSELDFEVLDTYLSNLASNDGPCDSPNDRKRPAVPNQSRNRAGVI
jgi:hypothetical protein